MGLSVIRTFLASLYAKRTLQKQRSPAGGRRAANTIQRIEKINHCELIIVEVDAKSVKFSPKFSDFRGKQI